MINIETGLDVENPGYLTFCICTEQRVLLLDMQLKRPQEYTSLKALCQGGLEIIQKSISKTRNTVNPNQAFDQTYLFCC